MKQCFHLPGVLLLGTLLTAGAARAQISSSSASMADLIDAPSLALGESSVARIGDPGAWNSNPATIATVHGGGGQLATRSLPWDLGGNTGYYSIGGWLATPIGAFEINYNLLDLGDLLQVFENGATGPTIHNYEHTIALTYGVPIAEGVALGASVKRFETSVASVSADTLLPSEPISASGFWLDVGAIYSMGDLLASDGIADTLHTGISIQDLGGDLKYPEQSMIQPIPNRLRIGATYSVSLLDTDATPSFRASVSAEYRRLLNPPSGYEDRQNQVGIGVEATILDLLSLRLGTTVQSYDDLYAQKDKALIRYGLGLNLPLIYLGSRLPLTLGIDYGVVPSADLSAANARDIKAFDVHVGYTGNLFE